VVDANRKVYVYGAAGALLGSWTAGSMTSSATPEGIATNGTDIWIVDAQSDKVFRRGRRDRTLRQSECRQKLQPQLQQP
jgi:hypothetical protein